MDVSQNFIRLLFIFLCLMMTTTYTTATEGLTTNALTLGLMTGSMAAAILIGLEMLLHRLNLKTFNIVTLGLLCGALMAYALTNILSSVLDFQQLGLSTQTISLIYGGIYLTTTYLAVMATAHSADELYVSLPFIKLKAASLKKKDILVDASVLQDARMIDLASSGLLDHHLIIPRFILTELYQENEKGDENSRNSARRALEVVKKLESLPHLELRYSDTNFPEIKDPLEKLVKLARILDTNILTADMSQIQQASLEDLRVIKFQQLCNALKPLTQSGEYISIKVQRYGKEARQGVGYLEDGTMVVVNGGAEYIGETIKAQVLSVKHTSSGRMIFCNALDEEENLDEREYATSAHSADRDSSHKNYFAL